MALVSSTWATLREARNRRAAAWIKRRQGTDILPVTLQRRRIYILPTRAGFGFAALVFVMLVAGLNYANSIALLLTFLLAGLALVAMHACHRNLLQVQVAHLSVGEVHAGARAQLTLLLAETTGLRRPGLWMDGAVARVAFDLEPGATTRVDLQLPTPAPGPLQLGRLRIATSFPMGLFRAWTWLHIPLTLIVPAGDANPASTARRDPRGAQADEWQDLRPYREGDSLRQVAWRAYARGAPLLVKTYAAGDSATPRRPRRTDWRPPVAAPVSPRRAQLWVLAALLGGATLHLGQLPLWISGVTFACAAWSVAVHIGRVPAPGKLPKTTLVVLLTLGVLGSFHTLNGLDAGTALLSLMGAVKLLESTNRRDRYIVVAVAFYLLLAACLQSQALPRMPLYLAQAWVCITALAATAHPQVAAETGRIARLSARSLLYALPLAALLFVLFPRLAGGFWSIGNTRASTGLSDTMSPGSISELGESSDPVFRVWFDGPVPGPGDRYWRGPVLHQFDGYTWTRSSGSLYRAEDLKYTGAAYHYRVRLEPDAGPWWPALDTLKETDARATNVTPDRQLVSSRPLHDPVTYNAVSYLHTTSSDTLSRLAQRVDLQLPAGRNPRSRALALQLHAAAPDVPAFIDAVLARFRGGGFEYTLTPPLLDLNSVDDFLFHTRQGFCGHFASAFVMLMRAGGVPARVVTGYQGGEWNPIGGYLLVRRSDAHAWAEVWIDGRGWVRVDPTAAAAPQRLQRGVMDLLSNAGSLPARLEHQVSWLNALHQSWDAANAWWSTQFVGYNYRSQLRLLDRLGFSAPGWQQLGWLLATALSLWLLIVGWGYSRLPRARADRLARAYQTLCSRLARAGFTRQPQQGPLDYARALDGAPSALRDPARALLSRYARLRFGPGTAVEAEIDRFETDVRKLRPPL